MTRCSPGRLVVALALVAMTTGCPPTGEPPPFDPTRPDGAFDRGPDGRTPLPDADPDADPDAAPDAAPDVLIDQGPRPECVDRDGDGYVTGAGCRLPPGDCAPDDGDRAPGRAERCDGLDDDCDEAVDEDAPAGAPCETDEPGVCAAGITACVAGAPACAQVERPAAVDRCDGVDEDCDGQVDEEPPGAGLPCAVPDRVGACAAGTTACLAGAIACVPEVGAAPEVCNGLDDDCDGTADENDPGAGADCVGDLLGLCRFGTTVCAGGEGVVCRSRFEPIPERCNDLDDDCDGAVDEAFAALLGQPCVVGAGRCAGEGVRVCSAAGDRTVCDASAVDGVPETCDGTDEDCDGEVDEGFGVGDACVEGLGACAVEGAIACRDGRARCDAEPGEALDEICNAADDDCDGVVDEGFPVGLACIDRAGECPAPGSLICGDDGGVVCDARPVMPRDELCNARDDDCDGATDEDFPALGDTCVVGVGACTRAGVLICADDAAACSLEPGAPSAELCDGLDDDCDGRPDNRAPCLGPPTAVATLRFADPDDPACLDLDGDGAPDPDAPGNAFAALADDFGPPLAADFADGGRVLLVRVPDADDPGASPLRVELVEGHPDGPAPLLRSLTPEGRGRHPVRGVERVGDRIAGGAPGSVRLLSPLFYDRDPAFEVESGLVLHAPRVAGTIRAEGAGLTVEGLRLVGLVDRAALLTRYVAAAQRCTAVGPAAPPGCDLPRRITPFALDRLLVADVDRDPAPGLDAISACFVIDGLPRDAAASVPYGGGPCAADSDCFANLACRPMPTGGPPNGAVLVERCGVSGVGGGVIGDPCAGDDDCADALCVAATARGGTCTGLCDADVDCPEGLVCRGVARAVDGALTPGGASASVCVPVDGSGLACGSDADCPADELCGVWLDGAGALGDGVSAGGRCQALDPLGAPLGALCDGPADCAHGNGCVPDLVGALRCLPPCDGAGQCADGAICVERDMLAPVARFPAVQHGFCLPVPPALGSGGRCAADAGCPTGETCTPRRLATTGAVERYCGAGVGFSTIGQPCAAGDDCASGRCDAGLCAGLCAGPGECGSFMGCAPDALRDADDRVLGGLCRRATLGCGSDLDCAADPPCEGDRCVCDDGRCRIGCRAPDGLCPAAEERCGADGACAPYCRDDGDEPSDGRAAAAPLAVGPRAPIVELRRTLCAGSPVDWYRLSPAGQPVEVRLDRRPEPGLIVALDLFDADGSLLDEGVRLAPLDVVLATVEAPPGDVWIRVRAAGLVDRVDYQLRVELQGPACVDPTEPIPADRPLDAIELLAAPGPAAVEATDGVLCPADVDLHPIWLDVDDRLTLDLAVPDPRGAGVELRLWGPDAPGLPGSVARASLLDGDGGRVVYTARPMTCPAGGGRCRHEGVATALPCASDADCRGAPYFVELRGATDRDGGGWRLTASVDRPAPRACVPDPREPDDRAQSPERLAALAPALFDGAALRPDRDLVVTGARVCRRAPDGQGVDVDRITTEARAGERLFVEVLPDDDAALEIRIIGPDEALLGAVPVDGETNTGRDLDADGRYAVEITRPDAVDPARGYAVRLRRETSASDDRGCLAATPVALAPGAPTVIETTTAGRADSVTPLHCPGGDGPDRLYAVTAPPGADLRLRVVAEALAPGVDPALSARTDCDVRISEQACNEDDPDADDPAARAALTVPLAAGATIFVALDSFDGASAGPVRLTLDPSPAE